MKALKTISVLILLLSATFYANAQFLCGVNVYFYQTVSGSTVSFHDTTTVQPNWQILSHHWDFGDGTTSNLTNPTHTYNTTGSFQVCEIVEVGGLGVTCADTFCKTINITSIPCGNAQASFAITSNGGGTLVLQSTSTGVNSSTLYEWWVDGNAVTNPNPNTAFTLNNIAPGNHTFCLYLYVSPSILCDSSCRTEFIGGSGCNASFVHNVSANTIHAESTSSGVDSTTIYQWNIWGPNNVLLQTQSGHNNSVTSQSLATGTYRVCLYLYTSNQTLCDSTCQNITVGSTPCSGLTANWNQTYQSNNSVQFIPANNTINVTHLWSFGDGTTSTNVDPVHCYSNGGLYTVCHIVAIPGTVCRDTNCHAIQANACNPCNGFFVNVGWNANPLLGGFNVEASVTPSSTPVTYFWSTGDTGHVIRVAQAGVYCVTAVSASGCSATDCDSVGGSNNCQLIVTIGAQNTGGIYTLEAHATGGTPPYTFTWDNGISTSHILTVTLPGTYCVIVTDSNGCVGDACYTVHGSQGTDTICGVVFEDTNGNGVLDSAEFGIPGAEVFAGNYTTHADSFGHYTLIVPSGYYSIIYCARPGFTYTIPISPNNGINCAGYYQVLISGGGTHCGFNFGVQNNSVSICGTVYLDANNNQVQDSTEQGIANVHIEIVSSNGHVYHAYTDISGHYCVLVPVGTFTIHAAAQMFNTCPITPQSLTVTASTPGQTIGNNNFAAYCQPGLCNLIVNITPHTTVTAGFPAWYDIQVCNIGTSVANGTLNMFYDAALTFDHASPIQSTHNSSTQTLSWNITNVLPGNCRYFWVYFDANTNVTIGQQVFTLVNVTPDNNCNDVNMVNNVDTVHQVATASWDPNNKFAYTSNHETNPNYQWVSAIDANQRLEYVINFQNLGTAPAVNVVVKDVISSDLDLASFELLGTSHPGIVTVNGSELNFKFSNIMLPAASVDEDNSHGWVRFAFNSVNGLPGGYVITDEADIYFDYNAPVTTNDAAVTMLDANGIDELANNVTVVVAPNPMSQFAEIRLNNSKADNFRFKVTDLTGRMVADKISEGNTLRFERNALAAGLYTYQVIQKNTTVAKGKLIMQ